MTQCKSQFTVEFMLIFTAAFIVFLLILAVVTMGVELVTRDAERDKLDGFAESVRKDLVIASESGTSYQATLTLPALLEGIPYDIVIDAGVLIVNSTIDRNIMVNKPVPNVVGQFQKGMCNKITKNTMGVIEIVQPC